MRMMVAMALTALAGAEAAAAAVAPAARPALNRAAQATGAAALGAVSGLRTQAVLHLGGLKGPIDIVEDVRTGRFRAALDLGVVKQVNGFDGVAPWMADASGIVDPQESAEARREAANDAYRARRDYLRADAGGADVAYLRAATEDARRFDVLQVTPKGGNPAELWIDAATGLPDRWVEAASTYVRTIRFSDYRPLAGVRLPFRLLTSDGTAANDQLVVVDRYVLDPRLSPAALDRPASAIRDARVEGGATELPIMIEGGHIVLPVSINGSAPLPFVLDSGATANVLTRAAAAALGIKGQGAIAAQGVGQGTAEVSLTRVKRLTVGDATLDDQQFAILDLPPMMAHRGAEQPIAGLLGYDMLRRFVTRIDYAGRTLRFTEVRQCPATRGANELPIVFSDRIPEVEASIDGVKGLWSIDTGASTELTLFSHFAETHGVARGTAGVPQVGAGGVGGKVESRLVRLGSMQFGPYRLERPYVRVVQARKGAFSSTTLAGNVGASTLRHFAVTLDYECRTMGLERGADYGREETPNRSGLSFTRKAGSTGLEVLGVQEGGPAARSGIAAGDRIIAIDGRAIGDYSYGAVKEALSRPVGTRVALQLERGQRRFDAELELADPLASVSVAR